MKTPVVIWVTSFALLIVLISLPASCAESQVNLSQVTTQRSWDSCPTWCTDGKHVLMVSDKLGGIGIWKMSVNGGVLVQITAPERGVFDLWPDVNRKTGEVVFASNRGGVSQVFLVAPGKAGLTQITRLPNDASHPRWSPDGKRILFCCADKNGDSYIWTMNRDGSNLCQVVQGLQPCWSPDGKRMAFTKESVIGKKKNWDIYAIGLDGVGLTQVTTDESNEMQPDWSPNGKYLAYVSVKDRVGAPRNLKEMLSGMRARSNYEIWIRDMGVSSSNTIQITSWSGLDAYPRWSPNGQEILLVSDRAGSADIWCTAGVLPKSKGEVAVSTQGKRAK